MTSTQKVAIVTGAGSGIGKAAALALLKDGYAVVLAGRRKEHAGVPPPPRAGGTPGKRSWCRPTSTDPRVGQGAVREDQGERSGGSTCSSTTPASARPAVPLEDLTFEQWKAVVDINLTGVFLCTQEAFRIMKAPDAARRAHHQQRVDLGARAAAQLRALHRDQARDHRPDQGRPRSTAASTTSRAARSTSATRRTEMTARMAKGVPQADGSIAVEPTMDVQHVARRGALHGEPAARRQRAVHDRDGDQDAVRRARLIASRG